MTMSTRNSDLQPKVVLGVVAHPDDLEFGMSGSVAFWANQGADIYYYILTNGDKGSSDRSMSGRQLTETRRDEQRTAAGLLGVKDVFFSDYEDGGLYVTQELKRDICRVIRKVKPDVVMTFDPTMTYNVDRGFINHPDHRAAGQATLDAVFPLARDHLSFPDLIQEGYEPHITPTLLLINFDKQNFFVDITTTLPTKLEALAAHASQMPDMQYVHDLVTDIAEKAGAQIGVKYAEGFLRIDIK